MINLKLFNNDIFDIINKYINNDPDIIYNLLNMNDTKILKFFNIDSKYIISRIDDFIEIDINKQIRLIKIKLFDFIINNEVDENINIIEDLFNKLEIINDEHYKLHDDIIKYNIKMYLKYRINKNINHIYIIC